MPLPKLFITLFEILMAVLLIIVIGGTLWIMVYPQRLLSSYSGSYNPYEYNTNYIVPFNLDGNQLEQFISTNQVSANIYLNGYIHEDLNTIYFESVEDDDGQIRLHNTYTKPDGDTVKQASILPNLAGGGLNSLKDFLDKEAMYTVEPSVSYEEELIYVITKN